MNQPVQELQTVRIRALILKIQEMASSMRRVFFLWVNSTRLNADTAHTQPLGQNTELAPCTSRTRDG